jgi:phytoene desaturase
MKTNNKNKKVIIVGGGLGGLSLAVRLAVNGFQVTICDKNGRLGGKMNILTKSGYVFDTGPTLITLPDIFRELFKVAGRRLEDHLELIKIDPLAYYVFDEGISFKYTSSIPEWTETVRNLEKTDVNGFFSFMELASKIYELSRKTFFKQSPFEIPTGLNLKDLKSFPFRNAWGNYAKTVAHFFKSPYLRQMFNRYPTYVGSSPYLCPATLIVIPYIEYVYGGWYIRGGLYKLVEALTQILIDNNVEIITNAEVTEIITNKKIVTGVRLKDNSTLSAGLVVMNGDVASAGLLLNDKKDRLQSERNRSLSGLVFLVGLNKKLKNTFHHSIYFSSNYETEFRELFTENKFPTDPTVYLNISSITDNTTASAEGETLFIMANAPAINKKAWTQDDVDKAWISVAKRITKSGLSDFTSKIVIKECFSPSDFEKIYNMPGGAIYGTNSHGWKNTFLRYSNKDRKYSGLYYVGGSTHPGGGTPMVVLSSEITSALIEKYERT